MRRWFFLVAVVGGLMVPVLSQAQLNPQLIPESGTIGRCSFVTGDFQFDCIPLYLAYLIQLVFGAVGTICLLMIIYAGYEWAFAGLGGDTQGAKKRLSNALLGLALSVLSYLVVDTIVSVLLSGPTS